MRLDVLTPAPYWHLVELGEDGGWLCSFDFKIMRKPLVMALALHLAARPRFLAHWHFQ